MYVFLANESIVGYYFLLIQENGFCLLLLGEINALFAKEDG